jgi:hypothetical protein
VRMSATCFRFLLAAVTLATLGQAHEEHPPYRATNMELVGHAATGTTLADVWVHRSYVYLGSRACGEGVSIIDARVPEHPLVLGRLPADSQSTYEDVVVISVSTPQFQGDLLAVGVQPCSAQGNKRGVHLWDVSDPAKPVELAFHVTGQRGAVHELDARQVGDKVLLFLAVPFSERYNEGGDFRIVDATDPRKPLQLSDWGVYSRLGLVDANLRVLGRPVVYCHSVKVSEDGRYAFLSYWDAGYITLDIANPAAPVFLSRVEYRMPDEGNAHSVFPVMGRNLLLAADEDYLIGGIQVTLESPQQATLVASELPFARPGCSVEAKELEVVLAGQGAVARCRTSMARSPPSSRAAPAVITTGHWQRNMLGRQAFSSPARTALPRSQAVSRRLPSTAHSSPRPTTTGCDPRKSFEHASRPRSMTRGGICASSTSPT